MVFGGPLTSRASSSPLFGDTLNAAASLSGSCWPAPKEGSTQEHRQLRVLPQRAPPPRSSGVPFWSSSVPRGKATLESLGIWEPAMGGHGAPWMVPACRGHGGQVQPTHKHSPVAPTATQVHEVDLLDLSLVNKAGPEVHPAGGKLQLRHGHCGPQGHHLGDRAWNVGPSSPPSGLQARDSGMPGPVDPKS